MSAWRGFSSSPSHWSAVFRVSHTLQVARTPLTSVIATRAAASRFGRPCEGYGLTFLRWKRLFPIFLRCARRTLRPRPLTTPTSRPPSWYLLFGVAGFLWERERISNEEVMRCLKQYEERVRLQSVFNSQPHFPDQKLSHDSQQSMAEHQQSSLLSSSESWGLGSLWSTVTFGWFGNTQQNSKEDNCEHVSTTMARSVDETSESTEVHVRVVDQKEKRRLEFMQEMSNYLHRHMEECKSLLPVVGLSTRGPSRVTFGAKLTNRIKQIKSRVLSHVMEGGSMLEVEGQEDLESDCCGLRIADLACLEMASHDHTCVGEADEVGDWFQYKISEFEPNLYSFSSNQSELSYHFYPIVGLQDHNKVANAVDRLSLLIQGSPLATVLQTIERLTHTYDHILGTDYHLDRNLDAFSHSMKTRWKQIISGVISEVVNELQELGETISLSDFIRHHGISSSTCTDPHDSTIKRDNMSTVSEYSHTSIENLACERSNTQSDDCFHVHKQAQQNERFSNKCRSSRFEIDSFHHFDDIHVPRDGVNGPPLSGELGQELLGMLRMAKLKVRQERQQGKVDTRVRDLEVSRVGETVQSTVEERERSEEAASDTHAQSGWELLAKEKSDTVYRRFYKDTGLYQYKVIGRYHDISARDYLEVQVNHELRKEWDSYATTLNTVDSDPTSGCELVYWIMKYPLCLIS